MLTFCFFSHAVFNGSNLGDGEIQAGVDDEREEKDEKS